MCIKIYIFEGILVLSLNVEEYNSGIGSCRIVNKICETCKCKVVTMSNMKISLSQ